MQGQEKDQSLSDMQELYGVNHRKSLPKKKYEIDISENAEDDSPEEEDVDYGSNDDQTKENKLEICDSFDEIDIQEKTPKNQQ